MSACKLASLQDVEFSQKKAVRGEESELLVAKNIIALIGANAPDGRDSTCRDQLSVVSLHM